MYRLIVAFILISASNALIPFHHHHHHHPAVSHQELIKHDGHHHPITIPRPIPFRHPVPIHHHTPFVHPPIIQEPFIPQIPINYDHYSFPEYNYAYSVHDHHTGDVKSQHESRHGDVVHGGYELIEPDGRLRKVEYKADDHTGFNAIVHHSSPHHHVHIAGHLE